MVGGGNANLFKNLPHKSRHTEWFFVYYGYSRTQKNAYAFVQWTEGDDSLDFANVNHYCTPEFFV